MKQLFYLLLGFVVLAGCANPPAVTPTAATVELSPERPIRELPVTFTPSAPNRVIPSPLATQPQVTRVPDTPIPFDQTVVELWYSIPALNLERRLQGNIGSQIIFVDESSGQALQRGNMGSVLLQLQQVLPTLELEPLPADCDTCVQVRYELALENLSDSGWLQEPAMLASIENVMNNMLGTHFPPDTVVGLRRSASPYYPAHTIALAEDGRFWLWLASEGQIDGPVDLPEAATALQASLAELPLAELADTYAVTCPGSPEETLYLDAPDADSIVITVSCPEFALPTTLLPLYAQLDALLAGKLDDVEGAPPRPPSALPLTALLDYRRAGGARLTLYQDGTAVATDPAGIVYTNTLSIPQIISLTTSLLDSGVLQPGLTTFQPEPTPTGTVEVTATPTSFSRLLVRGPDGVYDARWSGTASAALAPVDELLDALLAQAPVPAEPGTPAASETADATPAVTSESGNTPTTEPQGSTPAETPTASETADATPTATAESEGTPTLQP